MNLLELWNAFLACADGVPAQTFTGAVTKYTGVAAEDVLMAVWKSEVFKPGHYVAIDRGANKIVVAIR